MYEYGFLSATRQHTSTPSSTPSGTHTSSKSSHRSQDTQVISTQIHTQIGTHTFTFKKKSACLNYRANRAKFWNQPDHLVTPFNYFFLTVYLFFAISLVPQNLLMLRRKNIVSSHSINLSSLVDPQSPTKIYQSLKISIIIIDYIPLIKTFIEPQSSSNEDVVRGIILLHPRWSIGNHWLCKFRRKINGLRGGQDASSRWNLSQESMNNQRSPRDSGWPLSLIDVDSQEKPASTNRNH